MQKGVQLANQANVNNDVTIWMAAGTYREQVRIDWLSNAKKSRSPAWAEHGLDRRGRLVDRVDVRCNGTYMHSWPHRWGWKPVLLRLGRLLELGRRLACRVTGFVVPR